MNLLRSLLRIVVKRRRPLLFALTLLTVFPLHAQTSRYYTNGTTNRTTWLDHFTAEMGAGITTGAGSSSNAGHLGWNMMMGAGYRWNRRLSVLLEGAFSMDGLPQAVLQRATSGAGNPDGDGDGDGCGSSDIDGDGGCGGGIVPQGSGGQYTFWSLAVNPLFYYLRRGRWGGYIIGGGGLSWKQVSFTQNGCSQTGYGYGCGPQVIASESSDQPMVDVGTGVSWTILFLEARYVKMFTPTGQYPGFGVANTEFVPITLGARF